jgi:hypothetical protein
MCHLYNNKLLSSDITPLHSIYFCYLFVSRILLGLSCWVAGGKSSSVFFLIYMIWVSFADPAGSCPSPLRGAPSCIFPLGSPWSPSPFCDSTHSSSCSILLTYCIGRWMKTEPRFYFIAQYIQNPTTFILYWPSKDHAPPGPYLSPTLSKTQSAKLNSIPLFLFILGHTSFHPPPPMHIIPLCRLRKQLPPGNISSMLTLICLQHLSILKTSC